jgi:hypothetical protein
VTGLAASGQLVLAANGQISMIANNQAIRRVPSFSWRECPGFLGGCVHDLGRSDPFMIVYDTR